jgi:glycerol-3-phosphate cytidylyltransferase-like family protein
VRRGLKRGPHGLELVSKEERCETTETCRYAWDVVQSLETVIRIGKKQELEK